MHRLRHLQQTTFATHQRTVHECTLQNLVILQSYYGDTYIGKHNHEEHKVHKEDFDDFSLCP
jgi:hypothetical protein